MRAALPFLLAAFAAVHTSIAGAAERQLGGIVGTQLNPLGLQAHVGVGWKWALSRSTNRWLDGAHVTVGASESLSPAYSRTEVFVELSPLSVLDLRAGTQLVGYFGTFGHLVGFPSYDADFSDQARKALATGARARLGNVLSASATLKFAVGRLALRSTADLERWGVAEPGPCYYEPFRGTLLRAGGDSLVAGNSVLLLDVSASRNRQRQLGLYHDLLYVRHAPQNRRQRLGPFAAWSLGEKRFGVREPMLYCGVLGYVEAPNRSGVSVLLAVGFRMGGNGRPPVRSSAASP